MMSDMAAASVQQYRRYVAPFVGFLTWLDLEPVHSFEFDDFLIEYRNIPVGMVPGVNPPTRSQFEKCVAAIETATSLQGGAQSI